MSLIGSGTKAIQDFANAVELNSAAMDESFAAVGYVLGGVYWENGASVATVGKLQTDNLDAAAEFGNEHKETPRSVLVLFGSRFIVPSDSVLLGAVGVATGPVSIRVADTYVPSGEGGDGGLLVYANAGAVDGDSVEWAPGTAYRAGQIVTVVGANLTFYFSSLHT